MKKRDREEPVLNIPLQQCRHGAAVKQGSDQRRCGRVGPVRHVHGQHAVRSVCKRVVHQRQKGVDAMRREQPTAHELRLAAGGRGRIQHRGIQPAWGEIEGWGKQAHTEKKKNKICNKSEKTNKKSDTNFHIFKVQYYKFISIPLTCSKSRSRQSPLPWQAR